MHPELLSSSLRVQLMYVTVTPDLSPFDAEKNEMILRENPSQHAGQERFSQNVDLPKF